MTTPTPSATVEQFVALARRGQEATTAAAQDASRALQAYAGAVAPSGPRPVDPQTTASAAFDLAGELLRTQRAYVTAAIGLLTEAGETFSTHANAAGESFAAQTGQATERVVDLATQGTRRTAARNGVSV